MRKDAQPPTGGIYRPRNPRASPLYQCVRRHSDDLDAATKHLGCVSPQGVDGFIFTINVIADLGRHHCIEHGFCGPSHCVTAKIYHCCVVAADPSNWP